MVELKLKLFQIMHKYGKLTSCDDKNPERVDELFIEEIKEVLK